MKVKVARVFVSAVCSFLLFAVILSKWQQANDVLLNEADQLIESRKNNNSLESLFGGFVIENEAFCDGGADLSIISIVHSAVSHFELRAVLREQFASQAAGFKLLFLLGLPKDGGLREAIRHEADRFGDLVVGNFHDSYHNLTRKHLMGLTWAATHCRRAQFLLKLDDDIFVNYPLLVRFLKDRYPRSLVDPLVTRTGQRLIAGFLQRHMQVIRNTTSKWFVSESEFPRPFYEDFSSGWAYLTTIDTVDGLLDQASMRDKHFWIDDVYVTGELRAASKDIALESLDKWFNLDALLLQKWLKAGAKEALSWPFLFSNANGDLDLLRDAFKASRECAALGPRRCKCCFPAASRRSTVRPPSGRGTFERAPL